MNPVVAPSETKLITGKELFAMGDIGPARGGNIRRMKWFVLESLASIK